MSRGRPRIFSSTFGHPSTKTIEADIQETAGGLSDSETNRNRPAGATLRRVKSHERCRDASSRQGRAFGGDGSGTLLAKKPATNDRTRQCRSEPERCRLDVGGSKAGSEAGTSGEAKNRKGGGNTEAGQSDEWRSRTTRHEP